MSKFILVLCSILILASCKISQHYTFKKDFSGKYAMDFDLTGLDELNDDIEPDSIPNYFEGFNTDSVKAYYKAIDGISKVKVNVKDNVLHLAYKFSNLEALNKSFMSESNDLRLTNNAKFAYANNVFTYSFETVSMNDSLAETMNFFEYDIVMEFAKDIKTVSNGEFIPKENAVRITGNLGEVTRQEKSLSLRVEFD